MSVAHQGRRRVPENAEDLSKIGWSRSARTDKRVSAAQNIVAAKLEVENDDVDALVSRINDELPHDIRVFDAVRVTKSFNCKQELDGRQYAYLLPSCLLASNDEIDAAFASVSYGPEKIEECRNAVALAKRERATERLADAGRGCPTGGGDVRGLPRVSRRHRAIAAVLHGATSTQFHARWRGGSTTTSQKT